VIFTSGATEANNLAILGLARGARAARDRRKRSM
jgi:cysteine sulfinate desulfinase/cysteine desulfurase-like protein